MTSKMKERVVLGRHDFVPAVYNQRRCSACGYGLERRDREGFIHTQATEAERQMLVDQAHLYMGAAEQTVTYEKRYTPEEGKVDVAGFEQNGTAQAPSVERMRVGLVHEDQVVNIEVPMDVWPALSARAEAENWSLQALIDQASELIRSTVDGIVEISAAHRLDHDRLMAEYRQHVADTALKYGMTHDWCDEVLACLKEIGIEVGSAIVKAEVCIPHTFEFKLPYSEMHNYRLGPQQWVEKQVQDLPFTHPDLPAYAGNTLKDAHYVSRGDGFVREVELEPAKVKP